MPMFNQAPVSGDRVRLVTSDGTPYTSKSALDAVVPASSVPPGSVAPVGAAAPYLTWITDGANWLPEGSPNRFRLRPSGDATYAKDGAAVAAARDFLQLNGGGCIEFLPGRWYLKDHDMVSGVGYVCESLPAMNNDEVCADLGLNDANPFTGGAIFVGTAGTEIVLRANTTDRVATATTPDPADVPISGVRIERLVGWGIQSLVKCGGIDHNGLAFSTLRDLYGFAIKGILLDLKNIQHCHGGNFKAIDTKHALRIANNHSVCQTGNSHFSDIYGYSWAEPAGSSYPGKSTDWLIKLECIDTGRDLGGNLLNYVTLNGRIQCNSFRDGTLNRTRGNAQIVLQGASLSKSVNLCEINGTDIEGKVTYGLKADYTTSCKWKINGFSSHSDTVAGGRITNSRQMLVESPSYDLSLWIDTNSTVTLTGYIRYYAYDSTATPALSQVAKGIYSQYAAYSSGTTAPVYTALGGGNGSTRLQFGESQSYSFFCGADENVLRSKLIPIASQITPASANKTWSRWEASTVLISGSSTTQTLPIIDSKMDGVSFTFKAADANAHTIATQSSQLIDGVSTYALAAGASVTLLAVASGTKWIVTAKG